MSDGAALQKPGMPPLMVFALPFWAAAAATFALLGGADALAAGVLAGTAAIASLAAAAAAHALGKLALPPTIIALGLALGVTCAAAGTLAQIADVRAADGLQARWEFVLAEDASPGSYGSLALARTELPNGAPVTVQLRFTEDVSLLCGERIEAYATLDAPSGGDGSYAWSRGICAIARVRGYDRVDAGVLAPLVEARRSTIGAFAEHAGDNAGILQALVCGFRGTIEADGTYEEYKIVGLAHIVAVSGAHLALVTLIFEQLLLALRIPRGFRVGITGFFVLAYLVFSGIPLSAVRAACMVLLSLASTSARRRPAALSALAVCIIAFIAARPSTSVSVSFFLSASSTLGIVLFARLLASWLDGAAGAAGRVLAASVGLTAAATFATQPFSAALFAQLPLLSLPANIVAGPLFSLACVAGLAAAVLALAFPVLAPLAVGAASACAAPLSAVVSLLSSVPGCCPAVDTPPPAVMVALTGFGALALWLAWPRPRRRVLFVSAGACAALAFALIVLSPLAARDQLVMLDVGQGDAFLVRSGGSSVLIDTGVQDILLRRALGRHGVRSLDAVIVTHSDADHCGALPTLAAAADIAALYTAEGALDCPCESCTALRNDAADACPHTPVHGLVVGDALQVGMFSLEVLWPRRYTDGGGNADSLCLLMRADCDADGAADWTALLCGDAEAEQLRQLANEGLLGRVDVLKVGHHGARAALDEGLADTLHPALALVSVGEGNRYGHPHEETLARLDAVGATILRTDEGGDAVLTFTKDAIEVERR